ncbi:MAG TPA: hypothetical protein PKZ01_04835, partial [Candidatus Hydrogenedentes bacterium]|nr:hypothetical protein [Candidatus Hydrogenedentota bacterium]
TNPASLTLNTNKSVTATFTQLLDVSANQDNWMYEITRNRNFQLPWEEASAAQNQKLYNKAMMFQGLTEQYNLRYGQIVDMWYTDFTRSTPTLYDTAGDSACWTGVYLAGLANQYAVTRDPAVLAKINSILDTYVMLGTCTGKIGYIARFAAPASDPAYYNYYVNYTKNGYYPCVAPYEDRIYLGFSSRDTYVGTCYGLANVWARVDDAATRERVRVIAEVIIDTLAGDSWDIKCPPPGNQTTLNAVAYGFQVMWMSFGLAINNSKYNSKFNSPPFPNLNYANRFELAATVGNFDLKAKDFGDYFANNLGAMQLWIIYTMDTNSSRRATVLQKFRPYGADDHLQPGFSAAFMNATGDIFNNVARGTLQGGLLDFQNTPKWIRAVDQTDNPKYLPHNGDNTLSNYALLVRDRPLSDYLWQRSPALLKDGYDGLPIEYAALDVFVPYWMGRQCGAIQAP